MSTKKIGLLALIGTWVLFAGGTVMAQGAPAAQYREGVHYTAIENAPIAAKDTVEVVEAFSYLCNHCATFEPYVVSWLKRKPENVVFKRIPVVFGRGSWEIYARAYVTAEIMGIADKSHGALMDKLWKSRETLRSVEDLAQFYSGFGVDAASFLATSKSFAVDTKMRREQQLLQAAGVQGTPSVVVNGKYLVSSGEAVSSYDVMLDVVNYLVAIESASLKVATSVPEKAGTEDTKTATASD